MTKPTKNSPVLLITDDDKGIRTLLQTYLMDKGYFVLSASNGAEALEVIHDIKIDLLILDVMMPKMTGLELAEIIKKDQDIPIIMLTAMGEAENRIAGLEKGADDYMAKPFEPKELLLRIQKLLSRTLKGEMIRFGRFSFDLKNSRLFEDNQLQSLTSMELSLITLLVTNIGKTLSREFIVNALEGTISERSVDVMITRLRNKIEDDPKNPYFIQTVRNLGYIFKT